MQQRLAQSGVPVESSCDLSGLFIDQTARETECEAIARTRLEIDHFRGKLGSGAAAAVHADSINGFASDFEQHRDPSLIDEQEQPCAEVPAQ